MEKPTPEEIEYQIDHRHESYARETHISMSICLALAATAVVLRVLARRMKNAALGKDDYMIFAALVCRIYGSVILNLFVCILDEPANPVYSLQFFSASYVTGNFVSTLSILYIHQSIEASAERGYQRNSFHI